MTVLLLSVCLALQDHKLRNAWSDHQHKPTESNTPTDAASSSLSEDEMIRRHVVNALARRAPHARLLSTGANGESRRHVIAALVVNQPGCLAEIANLFAARGYNIDSLVVGRTEVDELSRMTVVVNGTDESVFNMKKQLEDVVHVAVANILSSGSEANKNYVERDLMLAKVSTSKPGARAEVVELANLFDAKVIDVRPHQVMVQLAGTPGRIEAFLELLKPLGITEIHRSGVIAMARSSNVHENIGELTFEGATEQLLHDDEDDDVDSTRLPPG